MKITYERSDLATKIQEKAVWMSAYEHSVSCVVGELVPSRGTVAFAVPRASKTFARARE